MIQKSLHIILLLVSTFCIGQNIRVEAINVNSDKDDFAPMFYDSGLVVVSNRKNTVLDNYFEIDKKGNEIYLNDLHSFVFGKDSSKFKTTHTLAQLNKNYLHDGPCTFSKNYDTIIYARSSYQKGKKNKSKIGLYTSYLVHGIWTEPHALNINSENYNLSQPFLSKDGKTIFFASDLEGGLGKMDIWKSSKLDSNLWSVPSNLGNTINSSRNDAFPYLNELNILYFSSNRTGTLGGFDIYYSSLNNPQNATQLKAPINSSSDDFSFISTNNGKSGYFSSNRAGNKDDDVYYFDVETKFENCHDSYEPKFCFTFYDNESSQNESHIKYIWNFGDDSISHQVHPKHCYATPGIKNISMSLMDTTTGVVSYDVANYELDIKNPLDYYYNKKSLQDKQSEDLVIIDHKLSSQIFNGIVWLKDETYFIDVDSINLHSEYPSEYKISSISGQSTNYCLQTLIQMEGTNKSYEKIKIVPDNTIGKVFSNFVDGKINEKLTDNSTLNLNLVLSSTKEKEVEDWLKLAQDHISLTYGKELTIERNENQNSIILEFE